jgi:hypothetical protein
MAGIEKDNISDFGNPQDHSRTTTNDINHANFLHSRIARVVIKQYRTITERSS